MVDDLVEHRAALLQLQFGVLAARQKAQRVFVGEGLAGHQDDDKPGRWEGEERIHRTICGDQDDGGYQDGDQAEPGQHHPPHRHRPLAPFVLPAALRPKRRQHKRSVAVNPPHAEEAARGQVAAAHREEGERAV